MTLESLLDRLANAIDDQTRAINRNTEVFLQSLQHPVPLTLELAATPVAPPAPDAPGAEDPTSLARESGELQAAAAEKPKRTRRTKAEIEAAKQPPPTVQEPEQNPSAGQGDFFSEDLKPAEPIQITLNDVREAALALRDRKDTTAVKFLLAKYDIAGLADLPEAQYAAFVEDCRVA